MITDLGMLQTPVEITVEGEMQMKKMRTAIQGPETVAVSSMLSLRVRCLQHILSRILCVDRRPADEDDTIAYVDAATIPKKRFVRRDDKIQESPRASAATAPVGDAVRASRDQSPLTIASMRVSRVV